MTIYYAVGGRINVIGSATMITGFGIYRDKLKRDQVNKLLFNDCDLRRKRGKYKPIEKIMIFKNKEEAVLYSEGLKTADFDKIKVYRAPIFEIELSGDEENALKFSDKKLSKILKAGVFDEEHYPLLKDKFHQEVSYCRVRDFGKFKKAAKILSSHLITYNNVGDDKYFARYLHAAANRKFFDRDTLLVFGFTFWTIVIPIGYLVYRMIIKRVAERKLGGCEGYYDYSPLWKNHDKECLNELRGITEDNKEAVIQVSAPAFVEKRNPKKEQGVDQLEFSMSDESAYQAFKRTGDIKVLHLTANFLNHTNPLLAGEWRGLADKYDRALKGSKGRKFNTNKRSTFFTSNNWKSILIEAEALQKRIDEHFKNDLSNDKQVLAAAQVRVP